MKRYLRGMVLLGVSATLWACNTESSAVEGGDPVRIVANPEAMFINLGETRTALVRLVDQQGGALTAPVTIANVGAGITVTPDSGFRPIYNAAGELVFNNFNNELRLLITANALTSATFDVQAEGLTQTVDVTVLPTSFDGTVTGSPADIAVPVTITAPAGLTFGAGAAVVDAQGNSVAIVNAVSEDGTTLTVYPIPGANGTDVTLRGVIPAYNTALEIEVPSTLDLALTTTVGPGLPGTDAYATAPEIVVPSGGTRGVVDVGVFSIPLNGAATWRSRVYRLEVAEAGLYDMEATWEGGEDLGIYLDTTQCVDWDILAADAHGGGGSASPESTDETLGGALELEAGSYCLSMVIFDSATRPNPATFNLFITRH